MFTNTVFIYVMSNWNALCIAWKWETLTTTFFDKKREKYTKTRKYWSKRNDINKKKNSILQYIKVTFATENYTHLLLKFKRYAFNLETKM